MLYINKYFKYHTQEKATLIAKTDCRVVLGVDKIRLKESKDGFNHSDLARAAFQHFLSWPTIKELKIKKNEKITIGFLEPYVVIGKYEITAHENIFFIP